MALLITDEILEGIWEQIKLLHENHLAHRDLRAANVFIDNNNDSWLIDFGFADAAVAEQMKAAGVFLWTPVSVVAL